MKVKTSITLSEDLLKAIDKRAKQYKKTRSDFIEVAAWAFIGQLIRNELNARDFVGTLPPAKLEALHQALRIALDIPD